MVPDWSEVHMVQLMPLQPHHLCFSKIQNGLSFWYWLIRVDPDKGRKMVACMCSMQWHFCRVSFLTVITVHYESVVVRKNMANSYKNVTTQYVLSANMQLNYQTKNQPNNSRRALCKQHLLQSHPLHWWCLLAEIQHTMITHGMQMTTVNDTFIIHNMSDYNNFQNIQS